MKKIAIGISFVLLLGIGALVGWLLARPAVAPTVATPSSEDASDFVPPTGRVANAKEYTAGVRRILTATSADGVRFTPTGNLFSDRANVPDVLVDDDGTIRVYYIGQGIEANKEETTAVALSRDGGVSWEYRLLTFKDFPMRRDPSDPDVVRLADGTYRMYYTSSVSATKLGIVYADSPDGMTFTYEGVAFEVEGESMVDSSTVYANGLWHMYADQHGIAGQTHATSADGRVFTRADNLVRLPGDGYYISDEIVVDDVIRLYAFSFADKNARVFTSTDGSSWTEGDVALTADDETTRGTGYLQDVNVAKLADGTYFMAYVTELPRE